MFVHLRGENEVACVHAILPVFLGFFSFIYFVCLDA